ncbi:MAG: Macrolide export ATP-binding/permease protein MacB [Candidatus Wolfebacteria bacterium GW2011_GWE1_48_7]|uniref:Macrolide export ATP-binding/permease protein MacB n=2 Tax=Candidatus Wolfeibacteriota TaxID=1752735 RepID=A0A0G1WHP6_9BACT|nr:MAG: ABC-type antimicrobial peptide transport system, ATPase component [Candidatus Wolfebacteria bacterium GW2011_GWB1_47_1]KKU36932.1 MAG: Macrolide export ATP-binding/permease protein MacB [Candidatus Wolfebacteria bacterium GW2011_GWC2_46_275]KKU42225.1 MAG: Macrolide export ATP-binding/permease protein MacB [Candidatus Wolfebacteria bacterium GW2011_GWB2_46_69]KKU53846.1 MAG: Macrolide export ATP-binding/permease protein MacB [Candidatus Wolfebacteria bacterium GW2011_GWC1_47_103]KKU5942
MEPIIKLEGINLYYDKGKPTEVWALKDVALEINKGEYCAFFGPSGCGKTTILYVLSGMESERVSSGQVLINGRDIAKFTKRELAVFRQIGVGIVFQQFNLIPSISVLDNVALPMAFLGISLERRRAEAQKLLERLNIAPYANRLPSELSGGQQQRVGIARALANNPPIIICDEPLGNLDSENANKVLEFMKELNTKDGRTVIMVTHEAWSLRDARKIFYMKDGKILKVEEPKESGDVAQAVSKLMYKQLNPNMGENQIMAKSLADLLLRGYSASEVKRFEFFLLQRLSGNIDEDVFREVLDRAYRNGGVGLWKGKAAKISFLVEGVMSQRHTIEQVHEVLEKNPEAPLAEEIQKVRRWLLEEYKGKMDEQQILRLDELIGERVRNIITPQNFEQILNLSKGKFGLGISMRSSNRMAEKLESILGGSEGVAKSMKL